MKASTLIFGALAGLQIYRFTRTKESWRVVMVLFWCTLATHTVVQDRRLFVLLAVELVVALFLKRSPVGRGDLWWRRMRLRKLSPEEQSYRETLESREREMLEFSESLLGRKSLEETKTWVKEERETAREENARRADRENKEAIERAAKQAEEAEAEEMRKVGLLEADEVLFTLSEPYTITTQSGQRVVPPGEYRGTIGFRTSSGEGDFEQTLVECLFRFTVGGTHYRSSSWLNLVAALPLQAEAFAERAVPWTDASPSWRKALESHCLLAGAVAFDDGRERFSMQIAGKEYCIMTKYLSWKVDLAVLEGGRDLLVRVHELQSEVWEENSSDPAESKFIDFARVPPFCTTVPVDQVLPILHPESHTAEPDGDPDEGERPVFQETLADTRG